ncbi:hypothetical protein I350_00353 [Cryptococcus amylolentus CBS 6273]|uniref:Fe2OG dioxygenase domain-containing protein n=1 Tax=Cryptococcus amylolentus CBS 6273 TaxID=1296118 RepID=A0A1E3KGY7_9TREE|nr:hypothetical protein I350_00353 [Cryptococcus amylolentus CBS 6273]
MSPALPIIDPAPYLSTSSGPAQVSAKAATAKAIHEACRDIGFFYIRVPDDFLSDHEMKEVLELGREFFHRPEEEKMRIRLEESDNVRGYQKLHQNVTQGKADHHEGLDLYAPSPYPATSSNNGLALRPLEGPNQWPTNPPSFKPRMEEWINKMKVLGLAVMHAMADGLDMDEAEWKELKGCVDDSFWVMRVIGYPPLPEGMDGISCGEHKDYGCLTLLHADPIPDSLQVLSKSGEWLSANPLPGCLVVNIGEMWQIWTGGLYPATLHRVVHKSPSYRVSVPFFFEPHFDCRVKVLEAAKRKIAKEGREAKPVEEVVYGDFLLGKVSGNFKY